MRIEERQVDGKVILDLKPPREGQFSKELFIPQIESILEAGHRQIILNLSALRWMNSSTMGLLMSAHRISDAADARMVFAGANGRIVDIMRITGMLQVWKTYPDVESAIASFDESEEASAG
ncbi:MAG TPA: STAS domain-containing protein [Candidatus Krumholzibacteria bacterium]|jgi:anti-anti-sigma factor